MIKKLLLGLTVLLALTGCEDEKVLATRREIVVVKPDPASYAMCPKYLDLPVVTDTKTGQRALETIYYLGYEKCRTVVEDIQKEIDRLEQEMKDQP